LRDYGIDGQIGMEETPELFVAKIVEVFREVKRVLRYDGTLWLNFGDSYASGAGGRGDVGNLINGVQTRTQGVGEGRIKRDIPEGLKPKDMIGIPWMVAFALRADGWYLRSDIIWSKPNPMPESVTDRPTKAHEYVFLMTKSARYYYDADAIRETYKESSLNRFESNFRSDTPSAQATKNPSVKIDGKISANPSGRNARTVWEIATQPTPEAHFATFPEALVEPCIKAGTSERGCCSKCGAPWERIIEKSGGLTGKGWTDHKADLEKGSSQCFRADGGEKPYTIKNLGWQPTCKCNADTVPCVVLDPFGGSGTTAKVARDLKRDCILIELNPKYIGIAREKLRLNEQLVNA